MRLTFELLQRGIFGSPVSYPELLYYALEFKPLFPSGYTFWTQRQAQGLGPVTWIWLRLRPCGPAPAPSL